MLKHNIEFKGREPDQKVRELIEYLISKLDRKVKNFSSEVVFLRVLVEENPTRTLYPISITLQLPGKTLATREEKHDLVDSIRDAFGEIERQLEKYKSSLRGEHLWKRLGKREKIRQTKLNTPPPEQRNRETFFALVTPHLDRLYHFVRHVIRYSEAMGDVGRGELTAEDIVDGAIVRAYRDFRKGLSIRDVRSWLIRAAIDELDREVQRSERQREFALSIEQDVPETPPIEAVSTLGDEILDFYQPDEDLKLEDIVPDLEVPTPEQVIETKELQACVRKALMEMPRQWLQALLRGVEDKSKEQSERILEHAQSYLRQKLVEAGCTFKGSKGPAKRVA